MKWKCYNLQIQLKGNRSAVDRCAALWRDSANVQSISVSPPKKSVLKASNADFLAQKLAVKGFRFLVQKQQRSWSSSVLVSYSGFNWFSRGRKKKLYELLKQLLQHNPLLPPSICMISMFQTVIVLPEYA